MDKFIYYFVLFITAFVLGVSLYRVYLGQHVFYITAIGSFIPAGISFKGLKKLRESNENS